MQDVKEECEGFCEAEFRFPEDQRYPCLPVKEDYLPKLMFPLRGVSYCTLSELRETLSLGAKVTSFRGYGFYPTDNEINHELKPYLAEMLRKKSRLEAEGKRGTTEYQIEKAKMVGIIGRFGYRRPSSVAEDISRLLHESGLKSEEFRKYGRKKAIRALYTKAAVGSSWHIEWASLIVGRARSMAAQVIPLGEKCLAFSTDGGFWLGDPKLEDTKIHKQIVEYHSGIRLEGKFNEIWIGRALQYVAWKPNGEVLHSALGGGITIPGKRKEEKKANFERMIREYLNAGRELYHEGELIRLTGLTDFIHDNVPLNTEQRTIRKFEWKYDGKRRLDKQVNVFKEWTYTKPYETVEQAYREWRGIKPVGRPKAPLTPEQIKEIQKSEATHRELAKKYNVSVSTIKRVRGQL